MAAAAGAAAAASAALYHPALLHSARFDAAALMAASPPQGWHRQPNKQLVWELVLSRPKTQPASPQPVMRFARYNSAAMPPSVDLLLTNETKVEFARSVYTYAPAPPSESHWHVNFADRHLFGFYHTSLFAQDEWQLQEHPSLCSLRQVLVKRSERDPTAAPLTVTRFSQGDRPTPCLVTNAPREVSIDAVGANIYGNRFAAASRKTVAAATTLLQPATLSNIIAMEALKHGEGVYTEQQISTTLLTARCAFAAAKIEAAQEAVDSGSAVKEPAIIVHTGNWGCGAFGGNIELMCMLQVLAARVAGVDRLVYYVLSAENEAECRKAVRTVEALLAGLKKQHVATGAQPDLNELARQIAKMHFRWGFSDGN